MIRRATMTRSRAWLAVLAPFAVLCLTRPASSADAGAFVDTAPGAADRWQQYDAHAVKSIVALQPFRQEERASLQPSGTPVRLVSLNPNINAWFLLSIGGEGREIVRYHIENPDPRSQELALSTDPRVALQIGGTDGSRCEPWAGDPSPLESARTSGLPFAPVCGGRLYLRNQVPGSKTTLERVTDYLRDHVWKGDAVVGFVRDTLFKDSFLESGDVVAGDKPRQETQGPAPAMIDPAFAGQAVIPDALGLGLSGVPSGRMSLGSWYPVAGIPDVYASAIQPKAISQQMQGSGRTSPLDRVEAGAIDYMVAFDLSRLELRFALGTDHPRLGWSPRPPAASRDDTLPGPDGVGTAEPLARVGMARPDLVGRTVATFTGGFKREHGAFKWGELSTRNGGTHYGFIEQGVIFSKLQPGLATLLVLDDGSVEMKTWTESDDAALSRIRFARQNGVPLVEPDPAGGGSVPGALVTNWGPGNWSGSADVKLRTLRAGACLQEPGDSRYLIYGYFSAATPSAMARTFQAYGCRYAMLLDMNALEHTYLALYTHRDGALVFEHLIPGMSEVDRKDPDGKPIPRFIGFPDNRDFFYLTRKGDES